MSKVKAAQMPGEVAEAEPTESTAQPDATVSIPAAQLAALMAKVESLEARVMAPVAKRANPAANLPDADSIDLDEFNRTAKTPILTKQGWLVPEQYGSIPEAKRKL